MQVVTFPLGPLETNCFIVYNDTSAVVVDAGGEPGAVVRFLEAKRLQLTHILLTHLHFDHVYGVAELVRVSKARVLGSDKDAYMLESELGRGGIWGLPLVDDYTFENQEAGELALPVGTCTVLATPGHSPGGLSFYFPQLKAVCAGDALFHRSIGRTDLPGGDHPTLVASIRNTLFALPEETVVHSGHGPDSTIGDEKRNNPHVSEFSVM